MTPSRLNTRRRLAVRAVALGLAAAMLCPPAAGLLPNAQAQNPIRDPNTPTIEGPAPLPPPLPVEPPVTGQSSLLLFPFVNNTRQSSGDRVAAQVADALRFRLNSIGAFKVTGYSKFLAPVQRAVQDGVLADADTGGQFVDASKAGPLATQIGTNVYLIGALESVKVDPATRKVSLEVSADLRYTATNDSIRTLAFTGTASPVSNADTLDAVAQRAVDSVAGKLAAAINGNRKPMIMPASQRGSNKGKQTLLLALLGGALVYAVLHNSNGTNNSRDGSGIVTGTGTTRTGTSTGTTAGGPPAPPTVP